MERALRSAQAGNHKQRLSFSDVSFSLLRLVTTDSIIFLLRADFAGYVDKFEGEAHTADEQGFLRVSESLNYFL